MNINENDFASDLHQFAQISGELVTLRFADDMFVSHWSWQRRWMFHCLKHAYHIWIGDDDRWWNYHSNIEKGEGTGPSAADRNPFVSLWLIQIELSTWNATQGEGKIAASSLFINKRSIRILLIKRIALMLTDGQSAAKSNKSFDVYSKRMISNWFLSDCALHMSMHRDSRSSPFFTDVWAMLTMWRCCPFDYRHYLMRNKANFIEKNLSTKVFASRVQFSINIVVVLQGESGRGQANTLVWFNLLYSILSSNSTHRPVN